MGGVGRTQQYTHWITTVNRRPVPIADNVSVVSLAGERPNGVR
jgi:hypothetical protein